MEPLLFEFSGANFKRNEDGTGKRGPSKGSSSFGFDFLVSQKLSVYELKSLPICNFTRERSSLNESSQFFHVTFILHQKIPYRRIWLVILFYISMKMCGAFLSIQSFSESEPLLNCRLQDCVQALKRNGRFLKPKMEAGALITLTPGPNIGPSQQSQRV